MMGQSIEFQNVCKSFSGRKIIDEISFVISKGSINFILGRSGTGKSVTLKLLMGLYPPDSGKILVDEIDVAQAKGREIYQIRKKCGMVFQHPALFDSLSVFDNIAFGIRDEPADFVRTRVLECMKLVHLEESALKKFPGQISFGMQKRVGLARTLAPAPQYILFDEPTTALDPITTTAVNELIQELSRVLQVTSIVVSHDMGCALKIAERIIVLDQGKVLANGTVEEIKKHQAPLIVDFLAESVM